MPSPRPLRLSRLSRSSRSSRSSRFSIRMPGGAQGRLEPPARRLQRVRGEVEALCAWAESRKQGKALEGDSVAEVERLGAEIGKVAELVQQAAASQQEALPPEGA